MTWNNNNILAVVPARGGSRGIPRKNLAIIAGDSLIGHVTKVIGDLDDIIDNSFLSTDDEEIAAEGKRCGLEVPFLRPEHLSSDTATANDVWRHAWLFAEEHYGKRFDISILLEPTSPMRTADDVRNTIKLLLDSNLGAAITVSRTPGALTPFKSLMINEQGTIDFFHPQGSTYKNRQSAPSTYHRNGICYALRRETLIEKNTIIGEHNCAALIIDRPIVNIDEPVDLQIVEALMSSPK